MSRQRRKSQITMDDLRAAAQAVCNEQTNPSPRYSHTFPGYGIAIEVLHAAGVMDRNDVKIGDES